MESARQRFTIPTDKPEADGTIAWDSTTLIVVEVPAAMHRPRIYLRGRLDHRH